MPVSFDANILIYSAQHSIKGDRARELMANGGIISVQALNEIANVARRKLGLSWRECRELIDGVRQFMETVPVTDAVHALGLRLAERYGFSIYDAMIVAAAVGAGCETLWTEDMHDGLVVEEGLTIRNLFARTLA